MCRHNNAMNNQPHFESEFLESLADAFRRRRRSLSRRACRVELAKTYEAGKDGKQERLEIEIGGIAGKGPVLKFHAWSDRMVWIDARSPAKQGWAWTWTADGRLTGDCSSRVLIETLEETYELTGDMSSARTVTLDGQWKPLLARGLTVVR